MKRKSRKPHLTVDERRGIRAVIKCRKIDPTAKKKGTEYLNAMISTKDTRRIGVEFVIPSYLKLPAEESGTEKLEAMLK